MVEEVQKRQRVIEGSFSSTVTSKVKKAAWNSVTERVNAVSTSQRTASEVRSKLTDFKSVTKKKLAKRNEERTKTGGGHYKQPELSTPEELMSSLVHPVTVEGLGQLLEGEMVSDA
ncbi:nuclear apoptosis-inducing factor 1-like isoform X1 [Penaeus vannamei]|uniref:nuclear apoptosis-inducing factor 1-like isoform X1 n=1 Tax=Penaeus vannamei TaxID=6689 RepID=UPI00387F8261